MSVFLSVGAGFKTCCLEFLVQLGPFIHLVVAENNKLFYVSGLAFVCLSKLDDIFSRRICLSCVVQVLSHILNLGPVFLFQLYLNSNFVLSCGRGNPVHRRGFTVFLNLRSFTFFVFLFAL